MAKLPMYEQKTTATSARATPEGFGSGIGRAYAEMGNTLSEISERKQRREDVIDRTRLLGQFDTTAMTDLEALQAGGDMTSKQTVEQYGTALRQRMAETLEQHRGSANSRAELRAQLENQVVQYERSALGAQIKAQHTMIGDTVDKLSNQLSITAALAPDQINNALVDFESKLAVFGDAVSEQQLSAYRDAGRSKIAMSAVQGLLKNGEFETAKALMTDPSIGPLLDPNNARSLTMEIAVGDSKKKKEMVRQDQAVAQWTTVLGRNLSAEEQIRVRNLPPQRSDMSPADKIVELELVQGKPASPAQVSQIMGVSATEGGEFGNSLQGRALNFVSSKAVEFANGMLTPEEGRQFLVMYNEAYKPVEKLDPRTQLWTRIKPTVPAFVQQAIDRGSRVYGGITAPRAAQPAPAAMGGAQPAPAATGGSQPAADMGATQPAPTQTQTLNNPSQNRTIWQRSTNITGVGPSVTQAVGAIPVVGEALDGGGQVTQDREYAQASSRELIRALSQSGRYAVAEMQSIEKEVSIVGQIFDNASAYKQRLIGIDQALEKRVEDAKKDVANPDISIDKRRAAMDVVATITNFRATLGVPVRVKSRQEALKLPPGTEVITPDGRILTVPKGE